jgi:hypothetical protein
VIISGLIIGDNMKKYALPSMLFVFTILPLAGCSDETADKQAPSKIEKSILSVTVTGEVTEKLAGKPWLFCTRSSLGDENRFDLSLKVNKKIFEIDFPQALGLGSHPVYGANTMSGLKVGNAKIYYSTGSNGKTYSGDGTTGELTLNTLPERNGDRLTGSLKATVMAKDYSGTKVQIEAVFDVLAGLQTMDECK